MKRNANLAALGVAFLGTAGLAATGVGAEPRPAASDDTWITLSGTIAETSPQSFKFDYGPGHIDVEMDEVSGYAAARGLMENDAAVVYGRIDDDLFDEKTLDAASVYVGSLDTHFFSSAADEEDFGEFTPVLPIEVGNVEIVGDVTAVTGRQFMLDTGERRVKVDTSELSYNPTDERGFVQIELGDRVKVMGELEPGFFDRPHVEADWLAELQD